MTKPDPTAHLALDPAAAALAARLPGHLRERLRALTLREGRASVVLDAGGMAAAQREGVEAGVRTSLEGAQGVSSVAVALTAERSGEEPAPAPRGPRIVAVASGKGGVGKSTVAANLAVALARAGVRTGLVDADIYGPSQARLLATEGHKPVAHAEKLVPIESPYGVSMLSMAHLVAPDQAIAWRGPMVAGALGQLLGAHWDHVEVLVVDLPPGTGDVQLTLLQKFRPDGAVIVSTPQDLALIDAARAVTLFQKGDVPLIGVVENMAGYACPHCGEVSDPFGSGGAEKHAAAIGVPFLGRIPLELAIRTASDAGRPPAADGAPGEGVFADLARQVIGFLDPEGRSLRQAPAMEPGPA